MFYVKLFFNYQNCNFFHQNFSIIVDENTKRSKPASNDIVVLRKQSGSFRAGGPNGGHSTRRHTLQNGADVTMVIHFCLLHFLQKLVI